MHTNLPPMGWNSWNTFGQNIDEKLLLEVADTIVEKGLNKFGYEYVVIDDCWSLRTRGEDGKLRHDPAKFPHGMKYVADYIHAKGLKFGMYSCNGVETCAGYPASFDREYLDAETFAEWGVDFLKYDNCYKPYTHSAELLYKRMGLALANCGRDILFSACSWGAEETHEWIRKTGADMWRSTGDINDSWESIKALITQQYGILAYGGKGCFNDMDMLIVGMNGKGNVGLSGCTQEEYKTHFAAWCLLGSPLMMGSDIRSMDDESYAILTNKMLIEINQDPKCAQVYGNWNGAFSSNNECPTFVRILDNGDLAIGLFNLSDSGQYPILTLEQMGIPFSSGKTLELTNCWTEEVSYPVNGVIARSLEPHTCVVYRAKLIDGVR